MERFVKCQEHLFSSLAGAVCPPEQSKDHRNRPREQSGVIRLGHCCLAFSGVSDKLSLLCDQLEAGVSYTGTLEDIVSTHRRHSKALGVPFDPKPEVHFRPWNPCEGRCTDW